MPDSFITKNAIAAGLKALCKTKSFDKISIADITGACGLNRQTFYYHFADKYELLNWIYYNEGFRQLVEGITLDNWDEHLKDLLERMQQDKPFFVNTVKCQPDHFTDYLFETTRALFYEAIEKLDDAGRLAAPDKQFYARFYAYGCCGVVVELVKNGMKQPPAEVATQLKRLARDSERLAWRLHEAEISLPAGSAQKALPSGHLPTL